MFSVPSVSELVLHPKKQLWMGKNVGEINASAQLFEGGICQRNRRINIERRRLKGVVLELRQLATGKKDQVVNH